MPMTFLSQRNFTSMKQFSNFSSLDESSLHDLQSNIPMMSTNMRSANIDIKLPKNNYNDHDEAQVSRSSERQYESLTWRMYFRIMNARRRKGMIVPNIQQSDQLEPKSTIRANEYEHDTQEYHRTTNDSSDGPFSSSINHNEDFLYNEDTHFESDSDAENEYEGIFTLDT